MNKTSALESWLKSQGRCNVVYSGVLDDLVFRNRRQGLLDYWIASDICCDRRIRILMLLCQRPGNTGSGVVVREIVSRSELANAEISLLCGGYSEDDFEADFRVLPKNLDIVRFGLPHEKGDLPFPIVGMTDQMPYRSVAFKSLTLRELCTYLWVWRDRIRQAIEKYRPDLIHVHHLWLLAALCVADARNLPVIVSVHGTDLVQAQENPHIAELVRPWVNGINAIIGLTRSTESEIQRVFSVEGIPPVVVLGNGFSSELFYPRGGTVGDAPALLGMCQKATKVVLAVAKYARCKGLEWLLRAFSAVRHDNPGARLIIVGSGPEGELKRMSDLCNDLEISDAVCFAGAVPHDVVPQLMNIASTFVLSSFHEPFGLALLEAIACGCRIVSTDQGGPATIVPRDLRQSGDALMIRGLSSLDPSPEEGEEFVRRMAEAISTQIQKPLDFSRRMKVSATVGDLTWKEYAVRLGEVYAKSVARCRMRSQ